MTSIQVSWDATKNAPTAPNITCHGKSAQTITWVPVSGLTITSISTPKDPDQPHCNDFTAPAKVAGSGNWQCTDAMSNNGCFVYGIEGTYNGSKGLQDPQIVNDRDS